MLDNAGSIRCPAQACGIAMINLPTGKAFDDHGSGSGSGSGIGIGIGIGIGGRSLINGRDHELMQAQSHHEQRSAKRWTAFSLWNWRQDLDPTSPNNFDDEQVGVQQMPTRAGFEGQLPILQEDMANIPRRHDPRFSDGAEVLAGFRQRGGFATDAISAFFELDSVRGNRLDAVDV